MQGIIDWCLGVAPWQQERPKSITSGLSKGSKSSSSTSLHHPQQLSPWWEHGASLWRQPGEGNSTSHTAKWASCAGEMKHRAAGSCQRPGCGEISARVWSGLVLPFLHRGCFSFVKRVVHKGNRVSCAAKFIPLRSKTKSRAHQERDILASLSHDRITRLLDEFETRKTLILILELYPFLCSCLKRLGSTGESSFIKYLSNFLFVCFFLREKDTHNPFLHCRIAQLCGSSTAVLSFCWVRKIRLVHTSVNVFLSTKIIFWSIWKSWALFQWDPVWVSMRKTQNRNPKINKSDARC